MKTLTVLCSLLMITGLVLAEESAQGVGDFSLFDQRGDLHQMSQYKNRKAVVLLASSNECPVSSKIATVYSAIQLRFVGLGFEFMLLNSGVSIDGDRVNREVNQLGLEFPILMDENQRVSESLGIKTTDEVLVFDPKSFKVIYRGSVDRNLEVALYTILAGEEVMNAIGNTSGCDINYMAAANN